MLVVRESGKCKAVVSEVEVEGGGDKRTRDELEMAGSA